MSRFPAKRKKSELYGFSVFGIEFALNFLAGCPLLGLPVPPADISAGTLTQRRGVGPILCSTSEDSPFLLTFEESA